MKRLKQLAKREEVRKPYKEAKKRRNRARNKVAHKSRVTNIKRNK